MHNSHDDEKKSAKQTLPSRKSIAGPSVLTKQTRPDAIRHSMVQNRVSIFANRNFNATDDVNIGKSSSQSRRDSVTTDGAINIISTITSVSDVHCCKYTEKYDCFAAGSSDGLVSLYKSKSGRFVAELSDIEIDGNTAVTSITHRPVSKAYPINNSIICSYVNGLIKCWNYNFRQCVYTIKENRQISGITYHPRLTKFLTYGEDSRIFLYDEETQTQERILSTEKSGSKTSGTKMVHACCFNPRSNYEFISGGRDNFIQFWDVRQPFAVRSIANIHLRGQGLDINHKGTDILVCAYQIKSTFQIFDYATGKLKSKIDDQFITSKLYTGKYATADYAVIGSASPNLFQVVDLNINLPVATVKDLPSIVHCLDVGESKHIKRTNQEESELTLMPMVIFTSGKKVYEVDFS